MDLLTFGQIAVAAAFLMIIGWIVAFIRKRAEIVDVLWSIGTALAGVWCAYTLDGDLNRRILLGLLCGFWGARLGYHLFRDRFLAPHEDGRYKDLRKEWGQRANFKFFIFFQLQAFLIPFLATAAFTVATNPRPLQWFDSIALLIAIVALTGEALSDRQLSKFKSEKMTSPSSSDSICRIGFWGWSRHPNYFFEWLYWLSFPILGWGSPYFLLVFLSPSLMFYLVRYVTGIPPTENRMLESRGDIFRKYQKEVSAFVPWPPKIGS